MATELEPKIYAYSGLTGFEGCDGVDVSPLPGLRKVATTAWPDMRRPVQVVLLPLEDYEIITSDLKGKLYTPHRAALLLKIPDPVPPPQKSRARLFIDACGSSLWKMAMTFCAWYGAIMLLDLFFGVK